MNNSIEKLPATSFKKYDVISVCNKFKEEIKEAILIREIENFFPQTL